jgi:hypothetical protein
MGTGVNCGAVALPIGVRRDWLAIPILHQAKSYITSIICSIYVLIKIALTNRSGYQLQVAVKARPELAKIADHDGAAERGYASWKRAKVETGLAQSKKRDEMIPADKVWRELGLER